MCKYVPFMLKISIYWGLTTIISFDVWLHWVEVNIWNMYRRSFSNSKRLDFNLNLKNVSLQPPTGVKPNDSKVTAVKDFPKPQTIKQVKNFLGLANFYRRHVPRMAAISSRPLTDLTRKDSKEFVWTQECEEAFAEVNRLVTAPLLYPPNLYKEFLMWTDASEKGFGTVLEQEDDTGK